MKIVNSNPPFNIRELCEDLFDVKDTKCVWTFGDTIFNPHGGNVDPLMELHEAVHADQQGDSPATWWDKYFRDEKFRFEQELEAYRMQYKHAALKIKDRNQRFRYLNALAVDLSSPIYGSLCTTSEARKLIKDMV